MAKYDDKNKKVPIRYTSRDFNSIKTDLVNYAKRYYPNTFKDFNEASFGSLMLDTVSYVGDVMSFYMDYQVNESFLDTANEYNNVVKLTRQMGYKYRGRPAAHCRPARLWRARRRERARPRPARRRAPPLVPHRALPAHPARRRLLRLRGVRRHVLPVDWRPPLQVSARRLPRRDLATQRSPRCLSRQRCGAEGLAPAGRGLPGDQRGRRRSHYSGRARAAFSREQ